MNETEFREAIVKLHNDFETAKTKNLHNRLWYPKISHETYKTRAETILVGYFKAKHQLYEERSKAQFTAKVFSNGTDPVASAVRELVQILERYEDEILEDNQQMIDEMAENMRNMTDTVRVFADFLKE